MNLFLNILQSVVDFIIYLIPYPKLTSKELREVKIVAHRGWHDNLNTFENTMQAFETALENNLWGIEFDIRWTNDHVPIILHDKDTNRIWDKDILIEGISFKNLRAELPQIPTLEEVVERFGKKIHFFIELKPANFDHIEIYNKSLKKILAGLNEKEDFHFLAQSIGLVLKFNAFSNDSYLLVSDINTKELSEQALSYRIGGLAGHYLLITDKVIQKHKNENQLIGTGYVRSKSSLSREFNREADFVFTNHPWFLK